ncbi:hypothetical protein M422DRAFT_247345 [Sphaerobolus stellatus SS14]|nr:hypothetical protein M422DRAFT_247345 [Sphaerobolus stellatus SS14]
MIEQLLKEGNLTWKAVLFDDQGCIRYSSTDSNVLMRLRPMFGHPFLSEVFNLAIFNSATPTILPARFKDSLDPLPLLTLAYACTLTHCALKSVLKDRRDTFTGGLPGATYEISGG